MAEGRWMVEVIVMPKEGVNDPQGEAIRGGLRALGYAGVRGVRAGKVIRVELNAAGADDARAAGAEMADRLLANPVIESFHVAAVAPVGVEA
ncbi:MAG: Phosphoribosylformylglycinamidine synthase, PurS subunit [uncultured Thermomicrobiales bacterium]|uniref:Phosphoribosylformylglycinamidine synthase subunit PurS n=1 Tax=uncultured Thermomicrobiales bacterium TaxID=1645740 RepID=A0A6J4TLV1_9BACT|nr:MAG: Phosphoribosylformylglycinamidine synthase, PurS subunit [uncultured Thermomicrobiales bacterium]